MYMCVRVLAGLGGSNCPCVFQQVFVFVSVSVVVGRVCFCVCFCLFVSVSVFVCVLRVSWCGVSFVFGLCLRVVRDVCCSWRGW